MNQDHLKEKHALEDGAAFHIGNAMVMLKKTPQEIAEEVAAGNLDLTKIPVADAFERNLAVEEVAKKMVEKIRKNRGVREEKLSRLGDKSGPYLYVIVAILLFNLLVMAISIFRQPVNIPKAAFIVITKLYRNYIEFNV